MPKRRSYLSGGDFTRNYKIKPNCVLDQFHASPAHIRFLVGPWRSGKSVACVMELMTRAAQQTPGPDGVRRSRWAIVRNHHTELKSTTLQTFIQWFPPGRYGELKMDLPMTYIVHFGDVEAEFVFMALNREEDLMKLQSFECTGAWVNEGRFVPRAIIDDLAGRTGQYPDKQMGGATWRGLIVDTNPPDEDHWLPALEAQVKAWRDAKASGKPPPEMESNDPTLMLMPAAEPSETETLSASVSFNPDLYEFFHQPSGLSAEAENAENLPDGYYMQTAQAHAHDPEWIRVYMHGLYGGMAGTRVVYPNFKEYNEVAGIRIPWNVSSDELEPVPGLPIYLGWDFGLTPACIVAQLHPAPVRQLRVLQEILGTNVNVRDFIRSTVRWWMENKYRGYQIISTGDPAGAARSQETGQTSLGILRQEGIPTDAAESNDPTLRIDAVENYINWAPGGQPALLLDPRCRVLIQGFKKGYRWKRKKREGQTVYVDTIDKDGNIFTHPHDGLQYLCLGIQKAGRVSQVQRNIGQGNMRQRLAPVVP